jgi:hypothetical protein
MAGAMAMTVEERVEDYRKFLERWEGGVSLPLTALAAAIVTWDASKEIARHSKVLVRLTGALASTSVVLGVLTAVLVWRSW